MFNKDFVFNPVRGYLPSKRIFNKEKLIEYDDEDVITLGLVKRSKFTGDRVVAIFKPLTKKFIYNSGFECLNLVNRTYINDKKFDKGYKYSFYDIVNLETLEVIRQLTISEKVKNIVIDERCSIKL